MILNKQTMDAVAEATAAPQRQPEKNHCRTVRCLPIDVGRDVGTLGGGFTDGSAFTLARMESKSNAEDALCLSVFSWQDALLCNCGRISC